MSEGVSLGDMGQRGLATRGNGLAGSQTGCEPGDLLAGVRERLSSRARGGFGVVRARGLAGWCAWEAIFAGSQL